MAANSIKKNILNNKLDKDEKYTWFVGTELI